MKKVLFITTISGFLQQFEMNDVSILQELGYEVHYASNFYNPVYEVSRADLKSRGVVLHQIDIQKSPARLIKNIKAWRQLRKIIKEEQIDVIHCHNPMGGVVGRLASIGLKEKIHVIYTAHGFHFYAGAPVLNWLLYYPVERILAKKTDKLITINSEDYGRALKFRLRKNGVLEKIPGVGVKTSKFEVSPDTRAEVRKELGIAENQFYILSVGELNANKNHQIIIRAIAKLQDKNIRYGICGRGYAEEELRRLAIDLGIEDQVTLFGFRKDIPRMLAAADCFAFPSKREGLGIAALEAMAAGIPLITSDCRGTKEYMEHDVNGYVCKSGSVDEYVKAISDMREKPEKRCKMAEACRKTAKRFDIAVTDKIMRKIYANLPEK